MAAVAVVVGAAMVVRVCHLAPPPSTSLAPIPHPLRTRARILFAERKLAGPLDELLVAHAESVKRLKAASMEREEIDARMMLLKAERVEVEVRIVQLSARLNAEVVAVISSLAPGSTIAPWLAAVPHTTPAALNGGEGPGGAVAEVIAAAVVPASGASSAASTAVIVAATATAAYAPLLASGAGAAHTPPDSGAGAAPMLPSLQPFLLANEACFSLLRRRGAISVSGEMLHPIQLTEEEERAIGPRAVMALGQLRAIMD